MMQRDQVSNEAQPCIACRCMSIIGSTAAELEHSCKRIHPVNCTCTTLLSEHTSHSPVHHFYHQVYSQAAGSVMLLVRASKPRQSPGGVTPGITPYTAHGPPTVVLHASNPFFQAKKPNCSP